MSTDNGLTAFQIVRQRLFGIAYRMLGNAAAAEDIVQDVWLRWQQTDREVVRDAGAFLATATTRLAINAMHSARARHETPVESWQTEPADANADPRMQAERGQKLSVAMQSLLDTLTQRERAAFILREAFDYPYRDIAGLLRLEVANARQLVTRARSRVAHRRQANMRSTERPRLLDAFIAAARHGDLAGLEGVLAPSASLPAHRHTARPARSVSGGGRRSAGLPTARRAAPAVSDHP